MAKSLFSALWYRVAAVTPRLRSHVDIHRHVYRGELWYVVQDNASGKYHRFTPSAYYFISLLNGRRTLQLAWEESVGHLGDSAPSQDEVIQLLGQLHGANLLASDALADSLEIFERKQKQERQLLRQKLISPMSLKIPLIDPERMLDAGTWLVRPLFGWFGLLIWLLVVASGALLAAMHWPELTNNISDTVLTPGNIALLLLLFPLIKALHELGHAFAVKVWGGEVHELGIMLLVFMPVPYVDASAASAFRERYKRLVVGAAGMLVEVFVAAIALMVWLVAEPGVLKTLAYNTIFIASVTTVFFNANPLLRFDGYYMLADTVEIPNLATRANKYFFYLIQRYGYGMERAVNPAKARGERSWFLFYSVAAFVYRSVVMLTIALFVAVKFFFVGVILALMVAFNMYLLPLLKGGWFVLNNPTLEPQRKRALLVTAVFGAGVAALLLLFPVSYWTNTQGVVWLPENSMVRAGTDCFVTEVVAAHDSEVDAGELVMRCVDEQLTAEYAVAQAALREAQMAYDEHLKDDRFMLGLARDKLNQAQAQLTRSHERLQQLRIVAPTAGRVHIPFAQDLPGRHLGKGEVVAWVIQPHQPIIRAVITQRNIDLVREQSERVELLLPPHYGQALQGRVVREVPGASEHLPSAVLGNLGGGPIAVDPRDSSGLVTFQRIFQFDVQLVEPRQLAHYENRVYLRFYHRPTPLARQWYLTVRQVLLGEFGV